MTVTEIINIAKRHIDEKKMTVNDAINWLNECQLVDLMKDAMVPATTTIEAESGVWTDLPTDLLDIRYIEKDGLEYVCNYDTLDGEIRFPLTGTYAIKYFRTPVTITSEEETPEAHALLHYPMAHYIVARFKFQETTPNNPEYISAMNEYIRLRDSVLNTIKGNTNYNPTIKAVL